MHPVTNEEAWCCKKIDLISACKESMNMMRVMPSCGTDYGNRGEWNMACKNVLTVFCRFLLRSRYD